MKIRTETICTISFGVLSVFLHTASISVAASENKSEQKISFSEYEYCDTFLKKSLTSKQMFCIITNW